MKVFFQLIAGTAGGLLFVGLVFSVIVGFAVNKELSERKPMKPTEELRTEIHASTEAQKNPPDYIVINEKKIRVKKAEPVEESSKP